MVDNTFRTRPLRPGQFKEAVNQAGQTLFVAPEPAEGTLLEGFKRIADLDTAWEKAVYAAFVASEVHPFDDGNGRTARATMRSYLDAGQEVRIIVPTAFRNDYLDGLRKLSREDQPDVFIKGMRFLHRYTDAIDFGDFDRALDTLRDQCLRRPGARRTYRHPTSARSLKL